jgi:hypothetical protein
MKRREFVATVATVSAGILTTGSVKSIARPSKDVSVLSEELKDIVLNEAVLKRVPHENPFFKYRMLKTRVWCEDPKPSVNFGKAFVYDGRTIKEMVDAGSNMLLPGVEISCNSEEELEVYCSLKYEDKVNLANRYLDSVFRSEQKILNKFADKGLTPEVYPYVDVLVLGAGYKGKVGVTMFEHFAIAAQVE